jgi:hypothetical protein
LICLKRVQGFIPAEGLGVSPSFFSYPHEWGIQGVEEKSYLEALLWIPACAGMTMLV